jgi:hypothetical protein
VKNSTPGQYLATYLPSDPGYSAGDDLYDGYVYMPTPYGAIGVHIPVDNSAGAKYIAGGIETQFTLAAVPSKHPQLAPTLTWSLLTDGLSGDIIVQLLQLTARLSQFNLPEDARDIDWVSATLTLAGLTRGSYTTPSNVNLAAANVEAAEVVMNIRYKNKSQNFKDIGNDCSMLAARHSGDFKSHYAVRAFVTVQGYLQLTADRAIYPIYAVNSLPLANQTYRVAFFGKPQVNGFWSLTAYGADVFLVPNVLDRYSLGDRSNTTYPDGSLVYGGNGGSGDSNKTFEILLHTTDMKPPANYCSK